MSQIDLFKIIIIGSEYLIAFNCVQTIYYYRQIKYDFYKWQSK